MNEKKVAFIVCVNNEIYFEECVYYINRLHVPEGFSIDIIAIREADSMCAAYNAGMQSSDAKYKVYLHQDVMIRNQNFIDDVIAIFNRDAQIGMIGMVGGNGMPKTGVTYCAWNAGIVDCREPDMAYYLISDLDNRENLAVEAVDGLLMVTQYDVLWREDLFKHFDFYDVSQSFEMRKHGYRVIVPYQQTPWVIHDSSFAKLTYYDEARQICLKEYADYLYADDGFEFEYDEEWNRMSDELAEQLKPMLEKKLWEELQMVIVSYRSAGKKSSTMEMIGILTDIYVAEANGNVKWGFFDETTDYSQIYEKYTKIRFLLRRMELQMESDAYSELVQAIREEKVSREALVLIVLHSITDKKIVIKKLMEIYHSCGQKQNEQKLKQFYDMVKENPLPMAYMKRISAKTRKV